MNAVEASNVMKRFSNGSSMTILFKDMNFSVRQGELVAISGESGTGKSTLLQMIAAMTPANKGTFQVFGKDVVTIDKRTEWRLENIGYMNDESVLIPYLSVIQNLLIGVNPDDSHFKEKQEKAMKILKDLDFSSGNINESIDGLDEKHQILATIARILMTNPKLILADEPTEQLSGTEGKEILQKLLDFSKEHGSTVIIVTNDPFILKNATRHFTVENCQLVEKES